MKYATVALVVALAANVSFGVQGSKKPKAKAKDDQKSVTGYISDSHCGLKHMAGSNEADCVAMCIKSGGKYVLADRDGKTVYELDAAAADKVKDLAGKKVKVTGHVNGKTIHLHKVEAVS